MAMFLSSPQLFLYNPTITLVSIIFLPNSESNSGCGGMDLRLQPGSRYQISREPEVDEGS